MDPSWDTAKNSWTGLKEKWIFVQVSRWNAVFAGCNWNFRVQLDEDIPNENPNSSILNQHQTFGINLIPVPIIAGKKRNFRPRNLILRD